MFKSKTRPIIIPQSEHARLSGLLAHLWGNHDIAPPPLERAAFTMGVTHHDRGYGLFDTMAIGEVDESLWLATQRRGIEARLSDPIADAVALLHIRRLLSHSEHGDAQAIIARAEQRITETIERTSYTREMFEQADTITDVCDSIALDFSREAPAQWEKAVFSGGDRLPIQVHIDAGQITLHPWPLSVPEMRGFILGYEVAGYPDHPQPIMVEFMVKPGR